MTATTNTIPEAASEKRARGRPRRFPEEYAKILAALTPGITPRYRQEMGLAFYTQARLTDLLGSDDCTRLPAPFVSLFVPHYKATVLAELGRLHEEFGDEVLLDAARSICEHKMSAKVAVARIRRLRKGTLNEPANDKRRELLRREVAAVVDRHVGAHGLTMDEAMSVLWDMVLQDMHDAIADGADEGGAVAVSTRDAQVTP